MGLEKHKWDSER